MFVFPTIWRASFSCCLYSEIHPTVVTRKQSTPNFPKKKRFLPLDTHTYMGVSWARDVRFFQKIWLALFSCYLRLDIHPFAKSFPCCFSEFYVSDFGGISYELLL